MTTNPVWLLPQESGVTIVGAGVVAFRESADYARANVIGRDTATFGARAQRLSHAMHHEMVHHLHCITTLYLRALARDLVALSGRVLNDAAAGKLADSAAATTFSTLLQSLNTRTEGDLACRDLLESSAALEGYRLTTGDFTAAGFETYLLEIAEAGSPYRHAYDYVAARLAPERAVSLLGPLVWVALQSSDPVAAFVRYVHLLAHEQVVLQSPSADQTVELSRHPGAFPGASLVDLMAFLETGVGPASVVVPQTLDERSPFCERSLRWVIDHIGEELLVEQYGPRRPEQADSRDLARRIAAVPLLADLAAQPSLLAFKENERWAEALMPPVLVFSAAPGAEIELITFNVLRTDEDLLIAAMTATGFLGAAERLTTAKGSTQLYNACPHRNHCGEGSPDLCFRFLTPPHPDEEDVEKTCLFVRQVQLLTGSTPARLWRNTLATTSCSTPD